MKALRWALLVSLSGWIASPSLRAAELEQFCKGKSMTVAAGETHTGDVYLFAVNIDIAGRQDGDLIGWAQSIVIDGEIDGDVAAAAQSMELGGKVLDSVRFFGGNLTVTGTIEGDLIAFAGRVNIHPHAHITGDLLVMGGTAIVDGVVDGNLKTYGGEVSIGGTVGKNAFLKADGISLHPGARILGDLTYTSRNELDLKAEPFVAGTVRYEPRVDEEEEDEGITKLGVAMWIWLTLSAMLVGTVGIGLFRRAVPALMAPIGKETMLGGLIGFGTFLVVPAAALLAILLVVSALLGFLTLLLFLVALYLAKMPVALWLGTRLLRVVGRRAPSMFAGLILGLATLYLAFEIPYVGWLIWLASTWLGLGAMILAARGLVVERREAREAASL